MAKVIIGIGSNLGDREKNLQEAANAFALLPDTTVISASPVYETAPVDYDEQNDFLNAVLVIETAFSPAAVLGAALGIEAAMGRKRSFKNGPRIIDADLLFYEGVKIDSRELTVPHPRMFERRFVLQPLKDIFPDGRIGSVYFNEELSLTSGQPLRKTDITIKF